MLRLRSARAFRLSVSLAALGLALQVGGIEAHAAGNSAASSARPITGKLQTSTIHALLLIRSGAKRPTSIRLNSKTIFVVNGKRVTTTPALTRGAELSVVAARVGGAFTAQTVIVKPTSPPPAPAVHSTGAAAQAVSKLSSIAGAVTLTSLASVTLKTPTGTETIKLTAATRYVVNGKSSTIKPTLHAGEKVEIRAVQTHGVLVGQTFTVV